MSSREIVLLNAIWSTRQHPINKSTLIASVYFKKIHLIFWVVTRGIWTHSLIVEEQLRAILRTTSTQAWIDYGGATAAHGITATCISLSRGADFRSKAIARDEGEWLLFSANIMYLRGAHSSTGCAIHWSGQILQGNCEGFRGIARNWVELLLGSSSGTFPIESDWLLSCMLALLLEDY